MAKPAFLFAPGAGAGSGHPWMQRWTKMLGAIGPVQLMDYPYAVAGRKRPDPLPRLIAAHLEALGKLKARYPKRQVILIGKSMGGRVGCHVALVAKLHAVVCLGYPLCGSGDVTKLRDKVLLALVTPILFVQGTRDALCPLPLLAKVRRKMIAPNQLEIVEGGDHSLQVAKRQLAVTGETQEGVEKRIIATIAKFLSS